MEFQEEIFWDLLTFQDPCGQLAWLNQTLAETKPRERVFITAHVPPGYFEHHVIQPFFSNENYTKTYMDIITNKDNAKKVWLLSILQTLSRSAHANNQFYKTQIFVCLLFEYF